MHPSLLLSVNGSSVSSKGKKKNICCPGFNTKISRINVHYFDYRLFRLGVFPLHRCYMYCGIQNLSEVRDSELQRERVISSIRDLYVRMKFWKDAYRWWVTSKWNSRLISIVNIQTFSFMVEKSITKFEIFAIWYKKKKWYNDLLSTRIILVFQLNLEIKLVNYLLYVFVEYYLSLWIIIHVCSVLFILYTCV